MNTIKGYANYGVLAHEKQIIFTCGNPHAYATTSEEIEITLPEGFTAWENDFGGIMIDTPNDTTFKANDILGSWGDSPVMSWYDGEKTHRAKCDYEIL